ELRSMHSQLLSQQTPEGFAPWLGYAANEGNYWFSIYNNGLYRARRQTIVATGKTQSLDVTDVYPLLESRDGSIWIGTAGSARQGVLRLKDGALTQYTTAKFKDANSFFGAVSSLYEDHAGQLWVNGFWRLVDGRYIPPPWADAVFFPNKTFAWTMCED